MAVKYIDVENGRGDSTLYKLCLQYCPPIRPTYWCSNNCDYANYNDDFKLVSKHERDACHARAGNRNDASVRYTHVFFNYRHPNTNEMLPHYIDWLVNESPFAKVFLSKNPSMIMDYGAVVDWSLHKGLAFGACIATRATWEHAQHMLLWWELVKAGVNRTYAYLVALGHKPARTLPREGKLVFEGVNYSYVHHGGVDPLSWGDTAIRHWSSGTTVYGSENERAADFTFRVREESTFQKHFPIPKAGEAQGKFAKVAIGSFEAWIKFHVDNHVAIMEKFTEKQGKAAKQAAPKKFNEHEPVEDF